MCIYAIFYMGIFFLKGQEKSGAQWRRSLQEGWGFGCHLRPPHLGVDLACSSCDCVCVCWGVLGEGFQESDQRHAKLRLSGNSNLWTKTKLFTFTLAAGICTSASTTLSAGHVVIRSGYQYQVGIGIGSTLACWGTFFSFSFVLVCASAAETKGTIGQNFNDVSDLNLDCYRQYWPGI